MLLFFGLPAHSFRSAAFVYPTLLVFACCCCCGLMASAAGEEGHQQQAAGGGSSKSSIDGGLPAAVIIGSSNVSSHVLDIALGRPAAGVRCSASKWVQSTADGESDGKWKLWGETTTDAQGRIPIVHPGQPLSSGQFKLHFHTADYFQRQNRPTFFPYIEVVFQIDDPNVHCHVPITLSNFGYSTYKGQ